MAHWEHELDAALPSRLEYRPTSQLVQVDDPASEEYFPAPHDSHTEEDIAPTVGEHRPASQLVHVVAAVLALKVPPAQAVHAVAPVLALKVPRAQEAQVDDANEG
jgi:hypothetical protein